MGELLTAAVYEGSPQVHTSPAFWLKVVLNVALLSVRLADALVREDHDTARAACVVHVIAVDPPACEVNTEPAAPTVIGRLKL